MSDINDFFDIETFPEGDAIRLEIDEMRVIRKNDLKLLIARLQKECDKLCLEEQLRVKNSLERLMA